MRFLPIVVLVSLAVARTAVAEEVACAQERAAMVGAIRTQAQSARGIAGSAWERVLAAMGQVPRHLFMPESTCAAAYANRAAPIGHGQTISQPYVVALMTHLAAPAPDHTVLEVGTGLGYQAAVLSRLSREVCTIEIISALADAAAKQLNELGYANVKVRTGDGYRGWTECGPFDAIVVTAALGHVPPPLIEQLKVGGRLVMPLGPPNATQELTVVEKIAPGQTTTRTVALVRFVPFTGPGK
jgi:protein-L-isoaspartate(D-aspartate) O-methyltransferase